MGIRLGGVVIDTADLDLLARFWSGLLGLEVTRREDDWVSLGPGLALQRVPEPRTGKNRVHLDLVADDFGQATARAADLGAAPAARCTRICGRSGLTRKETNSASANRDRPRTDCRAGLPR